MRELGQKLTIKQGVKTDLGYFRTHTYLFLGIYEATVFRPLLN